MQRLRGQRGEDQERGLAKRITHDHNISVINVSWQRSHAGPGHVPGPGSPGTIGPDVACRDGKPVQLIPFRQAVHGVEDDHDAMAVAHAERGGSWRGYHAGPAVRSNPRGGPAGHHGQLSGVVVGDQVRRIGVRHLHRTPAGLAPGLERLAVPGRRGLHRRGQPDLQPAGAHPDVDGPGGRARMVAAARLQGPAAAVRRQGHRPEDHPRPGGQRGHGGGGRRGRPGQGAGHAARQRFL